MPSQKPPKPAKPYDGFPLFAHDSGQWAKTIRSKHYYFGPWSDWQAALNKYQEQRDDLHAGRVPSSGHGLTVLMLVNHFLTAKKKRLDSGELSASSFRDYFTACEQVLKSLGKTVHLANLRPADFERLRSDFSETHGPVTLEGDVTCCRVLFKYAADTFDIHVKYGQSFSKPSRAVLRKHRQQRGPRMFTSAEIRQILAAAGPQMKAMILLAVNCGYGNDDVAKLKLSSIDLQSKWIDFPRPKTGVPRRCPLWVETVASLRAAIADRPDPKSESDTDYVFITKFGHVWGGRIVGDSPVGKEFTKLLKAQQLHRKGTGFYTLRHVFQTVGEKTRDKDATRAVMGHAESANDMSSVYNEEPVSDERLKAVVAFVRQWLFAKPTKPTKKTR